MSQNSIKLVALYEAFPKADRHILFSAIDLINGGKDESLTDSEYEELMLLGITLTHLRCVTSILPNISKMKLNIKVDKP